ncbi:hypothetical protein [Actinomadura sp. 21ATH]|uniref:hypothetical protein n=1 Tax=Actinomadura sp. 21ATH TaxID=1735444 RepID=UPI0035C1E28A
MAGESIEDLVARVTAERGTMITAVVPAYRVDVLVQRLEMVLDAAFGGAGPDVEVRLVLGSACTTAARAVDQFVAALRLPYAAARGWGDFTDALGDRPASLRECVVVADAARLLEHEDRDLWRELVSRLHGGPHCLGGGWNTLVLADDEYAWQEWAFKAEGTPPGPVR